MPRTLIHMEARMTRVHTHTGATARSGRRARDSPAHLFGICGLGLAQGHRES